MSELAWAVLICLLSGALAGLTAGLFGLGGGLIVVPALHFLFLAQDFPPVMLMQLAITTSLFCILFTGGASAWGHYRRQAVHAQAVRSLIPGILLGALLGAWLASWLPSAGLRRIVGLFELFVAWRLLGGGARQGSGQLPGLAAMLAAGMGIGACSSLLGIGGGTLTVPFLLFCGLPVRVAIASSAVCGLPIALAGGAGLVWLGWGVQDLPRYALGYLYWPAILPIVAASLCTVPIGVHLAHRLPVLQLRRAFAALLLLLAIVMLS